MATNLNDIILVTLEQAFLGQQVINTFTFRVDTVTGSIDIERSLELGFIGQVSNVINGIQVDEVTNVAARWDNLTNGLDEGTYVMTGGGLVAGGQPLPSFNAFAFKLVRANKATRNGSKRIAGVPESWTDGNNFTPSEPQYGNVLSALDAYVALYDNVGVQQGQMTPIILGRCRLTDVGCTPGEFDLTRYSFITDVVGQGVTSQRSRKANVGS